MKLSGKHTVITGAASGIGRGIARRFAAEGAQVVCADLDAEGVEKVAREIGGLAVVTDVANEADVQELVASAERE